MGGRGTQELITAQNYTRDLRGGIFPALGN
jgi:hypothetical protein